MRQSQSQLHFVSYNKKTLNAASFIIIAVMLLCQSLRAADCPPDSLSSDRKILSISEHVQTTDESCLLTLLSEIDTCSSAILDTLASVLNHWTANHRVSSKLLCTGYNNHIVHHHEQIWNTLWRSFQTSHKPLFLEAYRLYNDGAIYTADTLLSIYDSEGEIDNQALSLWIKVKTITKDYKEIPPLYCRLFTLVSQPSKELSQPGSIPGSMHSIKTQFQQTLDESGKDHIPQILSGFKNCIVSMKNFHDPELLRWLAYLSGNYGLYDDELEITLAIRSSDDDFSISGEFADIARNRFLDKSFVHALRAGREAFKQADNDNDRSTAGSLIYQSFVALGLNDSALQWIGYAKLTNQNNLQNAINLYQLSGQTAQAQTLISTLQPSVTKDTLTIRQAIFSQNIKAAYELLQHNDFLKSHKSELYLWKVRLALFNKESDNLMKLLDSLPEIPQFRGAAEVLEYKYRALKLIDYPEALEAWQLIEYNIYINRFSAALALFEQLQCDIYCKTECARVIVHRLFERKKIADALAVLSSFDESGISAELLYLKALCLLNQRKTDSSRLVLEKILLDFPDDIYSGKARIVLSVLKSGQ
ncbi:MAG: hypothetical protein GX639_21700 [Fibrobacter sp.]|nr:hypothetical protein [Fibrobacter sp.]